MAGRTERVNARDLLERADGIYFEGDVVRAWLKQLARRASGTINAAKGNKFFEDEWRGEYKELNEALGALKRAQDNLEIFAAAVAKREGRDI